MLAEPDFFLVDVVLFQVENHLLLKALGIGFGRQLLQGFSQTLADRCNALSFKCFHLVVQGENQCHAGSDIGIQSLALVGTVGHELRQGIGQCRGYQGPFFGRDDIGLAGLHHVRHAEEGAHERGGRNRVPQLHGRGLANLVEVLQQRLRIDGLNHAAGSGLKGDIQVYSAAYKLIGQ